MLDIAARVPAAGEHQRHLSQHRAPVMNRRSLAAMAYRRRQLLAQPQRVRETPQNEQPAKRRDLPPPPSRPTFSTLLAFTSEMPFFSAQCVL